MIGAEAVVAQAGILPKPTKVLTEEDGQAARELPELWRSEIAAWLDQKQPRAFRLPTAHDFEKTLNALTTPLPHDLFSQLTEPGLVAECRVVLDRARAYALTKWPVRHLDKPERQVLLQPGQVELMGANADLAVLDDPDRMVDELRMETVTGSQVEAFKAVYPDLFQMLTAIMWEEIDRKALDADYSMSWGTELVVRRLVSLPPAMSIAKVERPPPAAASPTISARFDSLKTKAQRLSEQ